VKNGKVLKAMGGVSDELISRAATSIKKENKERAAFAPWLKWAMPAAACLVLVIGLFSIRGVLFPPSGSTTRSSNNAPQAAADSTNNKLPLKIAEEGVASADCYVDPDDWRGLPATSYVLEEQAESGVVTDRIVFQSLQDLADYADAFIIVPNVHEVAPDGENAQAAIAEYAETIGDRIVTRQWDDYTVSTGNRILIRQTLIGGCARDEPNNLLRVGGVYLLPVRFHSAWGAYEVVGDIDVLFELDDAGKVVSHSRFSELNRYDGKPFSELLNAVRAVFPAAETEFTEQPIVRISNPKQHRAQ
jgi:hypothetical protein